MDGVRVDLRDDVPAHEPDHFEGVFSGARPDTEGVHGGKRVENANKPNSMGESDPVVNCLSTVW
jgi:hypothetical protein